MNTKKDSPLKFGTMFKTQGYVSSTGLWGGGSGVTRNSINRDLNDIRNGTSPNMGVGNGGGYSGGLSGPFGGMFGNNPAMAAISSLGTNFGGSQSGSAGTSASAGSIGGNALMGAMGSIRNGESIRNRQTNSIANVKKVAANNKRLVDKGLVAPGSKPDSRAPLLQLKNNNMEYNNINNKAFSNAGTIKNIMGESVPNTFTRKVGNSPFKQAIDPMTVEGIDEPIAPPNRIATATAPPYDINNY